MFALWACNASSRSSGPAKSLMRAERGRSPGSCSALTSTRRPFATVTRTCTSPYCVETVGPSTSRRADGAVVVVEGCDDVSPDDPAGAVVPVVGGGAAAGGFVAGAACATRVGVAGEVWKLNSRANPAAVATRTGTARRIGCPRSSVLEPLEVDLRARHAQPMETTAHRVDEAGRPAHEAVALTDVRHERAEGRDAETVRVVVADRLAGQRVQRDAAFDPEVRQLVAEDEVPRGRDPVEQGQVAGRGRHRLEQGAQRCDADATRDEHRAAPRAALVGERAVRSFGEDAGSPADVLERACLLARLLDGDAESVPPDRGGQRERSRHPHPARREEPPDEELA